MADIMNGEEPGSHGSVRDEEDPTLGAELFIRLLPRGSGNRRFERVAAFRLRISQDRLDIPSVRATLHAGIDAEAATVPDVGAEIVDNELSRVMASRPAGPDLALGRLARAPRSRKPSRPEARGGSAIRPADTARPAQAVRPGYRAARDGQGPTAAAELHISLVHR